MEKSLCKKISQYFLIHWYSGHYLNQAKHLPHLMSDTPSYDAEILHKGTCTLCAFCWWSNALFSFENLIQVSLFHGREIKPKRGSFALKEDCNLKKERKVSILRREILGMYKMYTLFLINQWQHVPTNLKPSTVYVFDFGLNLSNTHTHRWFSGTNIKHNGWLVDISQYAASTVR